MDKNQRREALLQAIVKEYIKTAHPVSSKGLVEAYGFDFSAATIRNDMAFLEQEGYITQPHTSAGRVPTEKGYQYYIKNFLGEKELNKKQKETLDTAASEPADQPQQKVKQLAKTVAELSDEAVVLMHGDTYYFSTGLSHIMRKPEFAGLELAVTMSEVFDQLEDLMGIVHEVMSEQTQVMIGQDNPISEQCSLVASEYLLDDIQGVIGILGPMRMDYDTNIALLQYIESLMSEGDER
ncbi:DeoR family transcriptional regulator [Patescibacteria group bacterium]